MTADRARLVQELRDNARRVGASGAADLLRQAAAAIEGAGVEVERLRSQVRTAASFATTAQEFQRKAEDRADEWKEAYAGQVLERANEIKIAGKAQANAERLAEVVSALLTACNDGLIGNTSDEDTVGVLADSAKAALAAAAADGEG